MSEECTSCQEVPLNILVLQCQHNLCLQCAVMNLNNNERMILCEECGKITELDDEIVRELIKQWMQEKKCQVRRECEQDVRKPAHHKTKYKEIVQEDSKKSLWRGLSTNSILYNEKSKIKNHKAFNNLSCPQHPELELLYICETCDNSFICPQCAIHGNHTGHIVTTFHKYIEFIQQHLKHQQEALFHQCSELKHQQKQLKGKFDKKCQQIKTLKQHAKNKYELLYKKIKKEEEEVINQCEDLLECYCKDFEDFQESLIRELELNYEQNKKIQKMISSLQEKTSKIKQFQVIEEFIEGKKKGQLVIKQIKRKKSNILSENQEYVEHLQVLANRIQQIDQQQTMKVSCLSKAFPKKVLQEKKNQNIVKGEKDEEKTLILTKIKQTQGYQGNSGNVFIF